MHHARGSNAWGPRPGSLRQWLWLLLIAVAASCASASAEAVDDVVGQLTTMAEAGQFDRMLDLVENGGIDPDGNRVDDLIRSLHLHRKHVDRWSHDRGIAFEHAVDEMGVLLDAGFIEDALGFAIEAHGLAPDADVFLQDVRTLRLVKQAVDRADRAEGKDDWVEAANLYRRLDLLFDDRASVHHKNLKRASQHIRVMRMYIPDRLRKLSEQRAKRRGEQIDPIHFGDDTWEERLKGVSLTMLRDALYEVHRRHVSNRGYVPQLQGAIDTLIVLINTDGMEAVFPSLADFEAIARFEADLLDRRQALGDLKRELKRSEIRMIIRRIMRKNRETVKLPDAVVIYEMTEGSLAALDEFTSVIWPYDKEQFRRNTKGRFPGVGIQISMSVGPLTVIDLVEGSAAHAVGFRAGDEVVEIDGYDVRGYSPRYVMWKTRAESGGGIRIAVERKGEAEPVLIEADHGVTLTVKRPQGRLTVKSPLRGTPAYLGGVLAEDVIATVDGDPTDDWTLDQAVRNITGPPGTAVTLGIERRGEPDLIDKTIKRAEIEIESIKGWRLKGDDTWDFYVDRGRRIGYIRLSQFIPQSSDDMNRAINQMDDGEGLEGLILDLRFNPGGLLNKAVDVTNAFVKTGLIVSTVDADGKVTDPRRASPDRTHRDFPMVVLINQGSASASEIVSGALQDHGRATVVGTRSFGKGSVQDLYPIDRGHALLKLTTHHYRLPLNRIIHREPDSTRWGIEPNLIVEMSDDQVREALKRRQNLDVLRRRDEADAGGEDPQNILDEGLDPQLEGALLLLKAKAVARNLMFAGHSTAPQAPGDPGRYATKRPGS